MSLRNKLIFIFMVVIFMMSTLIGYMSYSSAEKLIIENKRDDMSNSVNLIDIGVTSIIRSVEEFAGYTVLNYLDGEKDVIELDSNTQIRKWLGSYLRAHRPISDFYVITEKKGLIYSHTKDSNLEELVYKIQKWGFDSRRKYFIYLDTEGKDSLNVYFLKPFKWNRAKDVGYFIIEFDTDDLANMLINNTGTFRHQYTMIVDEHIISATNSVAPEISKLVEERLWHGEKEFELLKDDQLYYVYGQYNGLTGWNTVTIVPRKDIVPQLAELRNQIILVVILVMLLSLGMAIIFAFTLTVPIKCLINAMKQSQEGDLGVFVETNRKDEIGYLIRTFNVMLMEIKGLIKKLTEEKIAQKNAEIKVLQALDYSQVSGHEKI